MQHRKLENFCLFVISSNKSFISKNLKVVGPVGGKFDLFSPLEFQIGLVLELCEGQHVDPGDKLDDSFNCIEQYMKLDASLR